ncbi:MAG: peptidoglycan-binding protein [bacterium]|nr:peptidoglycan-binding protein [bacterium]
MTKIRIAKIAGMAAGATLIFGSFVPMAGAATIAELQAQINALMAQLSSLQGGSVSAGVTFTQNLTIGSTGSEVTALQNWLISKGFSIPAGATGYFGSQTRAAVAAWQASANISPAVGYFGPISRGVVNGMTGGTPGPVTCPAGYTCSPTGGTTGGVITTPGVEGTVTVSLNPTPAAAKLYEGDTNKDVLGIKLEAKTSDIRIERVKLKLDENDTTSSSDTDFYRKIATKVYIKDGSTVLGSMDLNIDTVVKDGSDYFITVSGFNFIVPKDTTKVLTVALDAMSNWDDTFNGDSWRLTVPVDGIRGIDGANINQYGPSTAFNRDFTSNGDLAESATLSVSLNNGSPLANQVICTQSSDEDECDELELLRFDLKADKDAITLTDLVVDINMAGDDTATATTAYIYEVGGSSSAIGSATIDELTGTNSATFSDIDYVIPVDSTKTLSVRVDVKDTDAAANSFAADIDTADVTAENSQGTGITESGSATGKTIVVRNVGPQITLVSKSISTYGVPQSNTSNNRSTSTLSATFTLKIKAVGADLTLGTVASGTPVFSSSTTSFAPYRNGSYYSALGSWATSTSYSIPTACTSVGTNSCTLAEGAEVTIPVTWQILGRDTDDTSFTAGSLWSVGFEGFTWHTAAAASQYTNFMATTTDWRTGDVSFP